MKVASTATIRPSRFVRFRSIFAFSALLGFGYYNWVSYFASKDKKKRITSKNRGDESSQIIRKVPTQFLSRLWGRFSDSPISSHFITTYSRVFKCNMKEALISDYSKFFTLQEFFTRNLKPNIRPICLDHPVISPCDGKVLNFGTISADGYIGQIKGMTYSVGALLKCEIPHSKHKDRYLHYITLYLSPGDYHHFHSPAEWKLRNATHIPGDLLPVSPWLLKWVSNVFSGNERVVLTGDWRWGFFSFVAVGALNVGKIDIRQAPYLAKHCNKFRATSYTVKCPDVRPGTEVGEFRLGSTIVLLFEAPSDFAFVVTPEKSVRYGEPIGILESDLRTHFS